MTKIKISDEIKEIINSYKGNISSKKSLLKIYAVFYTKAARKERFAGGFFPVPSSFLKQINSRYNVYVDYLVKKGVIEYQTSHYESTGDLFGKTTKKAYSVNLGKCMRYRFLVDIEKGFEWEVDLSSGKKHRWYDLIQNSLLEYGLEPNIMREEFGLRIIHSGIQEYKNIFKGLHVIDSVCSQARMIYLLMKERGEFDINLFPIFQQKLDFYETIKTKLKLKDRQEAKDLFCVWAFGETTNRPQLLPIKKLFPETDKFLQKLKYGGHKQVASITQRKESKIIIDTIMNNIPTDFCIPIHDGLVVNPEESKVLLEWLEVNMPDLHFKIKEI